jgi:hypothetical protein
LQLPLSRLLEHGASVLGLELDWWNETDLAVEPAEGWICPGSPSTAAGTRHRAAAKGTGPNPTDRARIGWKWSVTTDRWGIPLGWVVDGVNRNYSILLQPTTLEAVAARNLLPEIDTLHLDRG